MVPDCSGSIEFQDCILLTITEVGEMKNGVVSSSQLSPASNYGHQVDLKEFGGEEEKDFLNAALLKSHHLEMAKLWFGQEFL